MSTTYYSEKGEDAFLDSLGILPAIGVYVDVGCSHPQIGNNCAFMRDRNWAGVSIDGLDYGADYAAHNFIQAIVSDKPWVKFRSNCNPVLARICEEGEEHAAMKLENILQGFHIGVIDVLSLDCEGGEYDAFNSMDFGAHVPRIVISEYNTALIEGSGSFMDFRLHHHLIELGYTELMDNGVNKIYHIE